METAAEIPAKAPRFYYGWVNVLIAALAMTATLPGRTHGLGLITQPLTQDPGLGVTEADFSRLNFWAIILGSAMCVPVGALIDRFGARPMLVLVSLGLGASVLGMSFAPCATALFITLVLIRGLGQGALSVVSLALVGKWFTRRLGHAMGVYTALMAVGFIASVLGLGSAVKAAGWRAAWAGMGWTLILGMAPIGLLFARSTPETMGLPVEGKPELAKRPLMDLPLLRALREPAFWIFTLALALYNMSWSAVTLFNESILQERGLTSEFVNRNVMGVLVVTGLPANILAGWLSMRGWSMGRLLAIGMVVLGVSMASFPWISRESHAMLYGAGLGISGGIVTVVFFAVYGSAFGRTSLGSIQAVSQVISVLASATGPVLLTELRAWQGSANPLFLGMAALAALFAILCPLVRLPDRHRAGA